MYDITASLPMDVNEHGLYEYNYINYYFIEENRYAHLIYSYSSLISFYMV